MFRQMINSLMQRRERTCADCHSRDWKRRRLGLESLEARRLLTAFPSGISPPRDHITEPSHLERHGDELFGRAAEPGPSRVGFDHGHDRAQHSRPQHSPPLYHTPAEPPSSSSLIAEISPSTVTPAPVTVTQVTTVIVIVIVPQTDSNLQTSTSRGIDPFSFSRRDPVPFFSDPIPTPLAAGPQLASQSELESVAATSLASPDGVGLQLFSNDASDLAMSSLTIANSEEGILRDDFANASSSPVSSTSDPTIGNPISLAGQSIIEDGFLQSMLNEIALVDLSVSENAGLLPTSPLRIVRETAANATDQIMGDLDGIDLLGDRSANQAAAESYSWRARLEFEYAGMYKKEPEQPADDHIEDPGMITLAHEAASRSTGNERINYLKIDGSSARYQAFETADSPADAGAGEPISKGDSLPDTSILKDAPTAADPGIAEDGGQDKLSLVEASLVPALLAGPLLRRRRAVTGASSPGARGLESPVT